MLYFDLGSSMGSQSRVKKLMVYSRWCNNETIGM